MNIIDKLVVNMSNDVSYTKVRTDNFNSSGGTKIFITRVQDRLESFFGILQPFTSNETNFTYPIQCIIDKDYLINYLHILFYEYKSELLQKYKDINLKYWYDKYSSLLLLDNSDLEFEINSVTKRANGNLYIQGNNDNAFGNYLYKILLAQITQLNIEKYEVSPGNYKFVFKPYVFISESIIENILPLFQRLNTVDEIVYSFDFKNILFKGVPGTGKSHVVDKIIRESLNLNSDTHNILRINIHSASSNSDLMQGIGISSNNGEVEYKEKQGLIYNHIKNAILHPKQPFALILEEIQENSLNELIGDLIYLIESSKRVNIKEIVNLPANSYLATTDLEYQDLINKLIELDTNKNYVELPYLIENRTDYRKMILPSNLYIFCTSNYRDDRKIIEDNLLRRFEVIEIYPKYDTGTDNIYNDIKISDFLQKLNDSIITQFKDIETHPDRFIVGHAIWLKVADKKDFYRALLKVIVDFKDIKDIEFNDVKSILNRLTSDRFATDNEFNEILSTTNYKELIEVIQKKSVFNFL